MRKLLYIVLFFSAALSAQNNKVIANKENFYTYGGKNFDEARSIKEIPGKQYIIAGTSSSFGQGNTSAYLIKTDSMGKHLWSYPYGGSQNDWAYSVEVTAHSGCFVAGYSNSFNPPNGYDAWYFKVDKNGILQWQKTVSGENWDFIYNSTPMPDGGYILCGESYTNSFGNADAYLIRIDKNGDTLWTKHYGGAKDEKFNSVCRMHNSIYAVGLNYTNGAIDTTADAWVVRLDTNGNFISESFVTSPPHYVDEYMGITPYDANSFFVCGRTELQDSNSTITLLARMDTALGTMIGPFYGFFSAPGEYCSFNKIFNISYGNICIVGTALGGFGGMGLFTIGYMGNMAWINDFVHTSGLQYDEFGWDGIYSSSGRVVMVGSAKGFCTTNPNLGLEDVFLVRYESDSISNAAITSSSTTCFADTLFYWPVSLYQYDKDVHANLFPNPVADKAQLEIIAQSTEPMQLTIYSVLGTEVQNFTVQPNSTNELDLSVLQNGSYFLKLKDQTGRDLSVLKFIISK